VSSLNAAVGAICGVSSVGRSTRNLPPSPPCIPTPTAEFRCSLCGGKGWIQMRLDRVDILDSFAVDGEIAKRDEPEQRSSTFDVEPVDLGFALLVDRSACRHPLALVNRLPGPIFHGILFSAILDRILAHSSHIELVGCSWRTRNQDGEELGLAPTGELISWNPASAVTPQRGNHPARHSGSHTRTGDGGNERNGCH